MPYETVFRAPLEIADGRATISWLNNDKGFQLDGRNIDVKPKPSMRAAVFVTCNLLTMNHGWVFWLASVPMMVHKPGAISRKT